MGREDLLPQAAGQTVVAERYLLERNLGNGGMGEVYAATDRMLGRRVALKRLSPALTEDPAARARFFREARALARINDPNVVAVFDAGEEDDRPFLVMELVQGTTIRHELRTNGRFAPGRAAAIGAGIAGGLAAAHAQGVIHRDVKPSNIFLTDADRPKVGDFGIARIERGDMTVTLTGQAFGSPPYIAPEQVLGEPVDARADLYSLGCVLYHMLAGRRPFDGDDAVSLTYQHVHTVPTRLDALDARVSPEIAALVGGLLEKDPEDRPQTADEVRRALTAVTAAPPEPVAPLVVAVEDPTGVLPGRAQALTERRGRRWWPIAAGAAGVLFLTAVLAFALTRGGPDLARARRSPGAQVGTSSPAVTSTPPTETLPPTPQQAGAALVALAQQLEANGAIDKHLADDIQHTVGDVLEHGDEPNDAFDKLNELKQKIADDLDHGKIASSDAQQLNAAIDQLGAALQGNGAEGD